MKKHQSYWVLLLVVLFSTTMQAKVYNYFGGYFQAGEWTLLPKESTYGPSFGGVGGLGFVYEMQAGGAYSPTRFLLHVGVGAQGGATYFMQGSSTTAVLENQLDLDGDMTFNYVYEVNERSPASAVDDRCTERKILYVSRCESGCQHVDIIPFFCFVDHLWRI